jgi:hypothetical protein
MKFVRKSLYFFLFISLFFLTNFSIPALAQTDWATQDARCVGSAGVFFGLIGDATDVPTIQGFECLFNNILQVVVSLAGIAFFIMFLNGGFQYIFSNGDQKKVATASSTLTMSIIGLVGVIASFLILKLIQQFTGANVTQFKIPGP